MQSSKEPLDGRGSTGNRIGQYSLEIINDIITNNPNLSKTGCRNLFLEKNIQYISLPTFYSLFNKQKTGGFLKPTKPRKDTIRDRITAFLTDKSFSSYQKALNEFQKETGYKTSYVYFYLIASKLPNATNNFSSKSPKKANLIKNFLSDKKISDISTLHKEFCISSAVDVSYNYFYFIARGYTKSLPKKYFVTSFMENAVFHSIAEAHREFSKNTGIKLSYPTFCNYVDKSKIIPKTKILSPSKDIESKHLDASPGTLIVKTKKQKKQKEFIIPATVADIQKNWDAFIFKNIREILKKKFHTVDEDTTREMVNDVYIDLCKYYKPEKYNPEKGSFTNWLYFIVRNCVYRLMREKNQDALAHSVSYNEKISEDSDVEKIDFLNLSVNHVTATMVNSGTSIHPDVSYVVSSSSIPPDIEDSVNIRMVLEDFKVYLYEADQAITTHNATQNDLSSVSFTSSIVGETKVPITGVSYSYLFDALNNDYTIKALSSETGVSENKLSGQKRSLFKAFTKTRGQ
jgi:hypothetical protein